MRFKDLVKKLIYGDLATGEIFLDSLRRRGACIGEGTTLFCSPRDCLIDAQNPYLLTIGKNVQITHGVVMLTHDYSWSVIKGRFGEVCGGQFPLTVGNNVFIGMNAVLLGGTIVGDDCVIGAGSVVKGVIPSGVVVAGNPARIICTIDEYRNKRRALQCDEAYEVYRCWYKRYSTRPSREIFREYFWLFESATPELPSEFLEVNGYVDPFLTKGVFEDWTPEFDGFEAFENYCLSRMSIED